MAIRFTSPEPSDSDGIEETERVETAPANITVNTKSKETRPRKKTVSKSSRATRPAMSQEPDVSPAPPVSPAMLTDLSPSVSAGVHRRHGLIDGEENSGDVRLEQKIRPQSLDEYIGQPALKERIRIAIAAAQQREETLDHVLLYGPPGLGKTTMASVLATEMGGDLHITSAPALERPRDLIGILMAMAPGSVLFIDEIHRLNKLAEEILYPAMEDFTLDRTVGSGPSTRILRIPIPRFTLVGATTKAGSIASPLRDRFGMALRLGYYGEEELATIVTRTAKLLDIDITEGGAGLIARRSRGTPRIANRLLKRVRDFVEVDQYQRTSEARPEGELGTHRGAVITEAMAESALALFEIDEKGLDPTDRQLLSMLVNQFSGGPVGLDTLASALGEDPRTIEDVYEPFLLQQGLIQRTPRGRMATPNTCKHLGISPSQLSGLGFGQQPLFDMGNGDPDREF